MKHARIILLLLFSMCSISRAQFATVGTEKSLPSKSVPLIVQAIEDEIYDYEQEGSFTNIGSTGAINGPTEVAAFISKSVSDRNIGWVLYKDMPYGEVFRRFVIRDDGLVVLYGDPELHFPAQQPDTNTLYLPEEDVCKFVGGALKASFSVNPNVSHERILEAEKRQLQRVKYSYRQDHQPHRR
jgi:hypothetical protein